MERVPLPVWSKFLVFGISIQLVQAFVAVLLVRAKSQAARLIALGLLSLNLLLVVAQLILGWIYGP